MVKAVVGANWGDEGKGKITDMLAEKADIIIRFQGGACRPYDRERLWQICAAYTAFRCLLRAYHKYYRQWSCPGYPGII